MLVCCVQMFHRLRVRLTRRTAATFAVSAISIGIGYRFSQSNNRFRFTTARAESVQPKQSTAGAAPVVAAGGGSGGDESSKQKKKCKTCPPRLEQLMAQMTDGGESTFAGRNFAAAAAAAATATATATAAAPTAPAPLPCPAGYSDLGHAGWTFLHTLAAHYPPHTTSTTTTAASSKQQADMKQFITLFAQHYPCDECSTHMIEYVKTHPPNVSDRNALSLWMCQMHNDVNRRLGKPQFDCSRVNERWGDGPSDGRCD